MKSKFFNFTKFLVVVGVLFFYSACSRKPEDPMASMPKDIVVQKIDKDDIRDVMLKEKMIFDEPKEINFTAVGEGIAPMNSVSHAQSLTLAKRAAMADAYSQLAGKLYGVKINAQDTVRDAMLRDSTITTKIQGLVKNASVTNENFNNGLYKVEMTLTINKDKWQEVFSY